MRSTPNLLITANERTKRFMNYPWWYLLMWGSRLCELRDHWYVYSDTSVWMRYWLTEKGINWEIQKTFPIIKKAVKIRSCIEESEVKRECNKMNVHHIEQRSINMNELHKSHHMMNRLVEYTPPIQPSLWGQIKALFS